MTTVRWSIAILLVTGLANGAAFADAECRQAARDEFFACKADCKEEYRSAKLTCRNVDPACGLPCMAGRQACMDAVEAILSTGQLPGGGTLADCTAGTDGCKQALEDAKTGCGAPCAPGDTVCDGCVDGAQVTAFVCRDTCRESWRANPTVVSARQGCSDGFKACIAGCPPAAP